MIAESKVIAVWGRLCFWGWNQGGFASGVIALVLSFVITSMIYFMKAFRGLMKCWEGSEGVGTNSSHLLMVYSVSRPVVAMAVLKPRAAVWTFMLDHGLNIVLTCSHLLFGASAVGRSLGTGKVLAYGAPFVSRSIFTGKC